MTSSTSATRRGPPGTAGPVSPQQLWEVGSRVYPAQAGGKIHTGLFLTSVTSLRSLRPASRSVIH